MCDPNLTTAQHVHKVREIVLARWASPKIGSLLFYNQNPDPTVDQVLTAQCLYHFHQALTGLLHQLEELRKCHDCENFSPRLRLQTPPSTPSPRPDQSSEDSSKVSSKS